MKTKREIIEDIDGEMNYVKEKLPKMDREKSEGRKEWHEGYLVAMKEARNKVNRLDEPETLTPEWIDERIHYSTDIDTFGNVVRIETVPAKFLQNLLVPKQELPVIPKFVADFIEKVKPDNSLRVAFEYIAQRKKDNHDDELAFWVEEGNSETFARAWLDGYTAEEEQKYIISINITDKASKTNYETFLNKRGIFHSMENDSFNSEEFNWTEEEIKDLKSGEILFEHFAVKVEELEG